MENQNNIIILILLVILIFVLFSQSEGFYDMKNKISLPSFLSTQTPKKPNPPSQQLTNPPSQQLTSAPSQQLTSTPNIKLKWSQPKEYNTQPQNMSWAAGANPDLNTGGSIPYASVSFFDRDMSGTKAIRKTGKPFPDDEMTAKSNVFKMAPQSTSQKFGAGVF